jgi:U3 small nucleolar RNA-associated protein 15
LAEHDIFLKKFQFKNALDSVLKKKNVEIIMSLVEELIDRNVLKLALINRNEDELALVLNFILWKIRDPKSMNTLLYVFNLLIDFYMIMYGKNEKISKLFEDILKNIREEIEFEKSLLNFNAKIDSISQINNYY